MPTLHMCDPLGNNPSLVWHTYAHIQALCVHSRPTRCVRMSHDLSSKPAGKGKGISERCLFSRTKRHFFSAAGRLRQVPADQPRAQECDFSYGGWAELWALIPDWRESRIFRHSEWRAGKKKGWELGKAGRLLRQKGLCAGGRRRRRREGGKWHRTFSFSQP